MFGVKRNDILASVGDLNAECGRGGFVEGYVERKSSGTFEVKVRRPVVVGKICSGNPGEEGFIIAVILIRNAVAFIGIKEF